MPFASSGNLLPMVANSTPANLAKRIEAAVPMIIAISDPGTFLVTLGQKMITRRHPKLNRNSCSLNVAMWVK